MSTATAKHWRRRTLLIVAQTSVGYPIINIRNIEIGNVRGMGQTNKAMGSLRNKHQRCARSTGDNTSSRHAPASAHHAQPSSFSARPAFQILVMWRILSPSKLMQ
jgi:hypothetical protein